MGAQELLRWGLHTEEKGWKGGGSVMTGSLYRCGGGREEGSGGPAWSATRRRVRGYGPNQRMAPWPASARGRRVRVAHGTPDRGNGAPCYGAGRRGQKGFEMIQNLKGSNEFKSF
jgi:hypothetical protein